MNFQIGDKVKINDFLGGKIVYKIIGIDPIAFYYTIEGDLGFNCVASRKVSFYDMSSIYVKVDDEEQQLNWYDGFLVPGTEPKKDEKYCNHDWKIYNGLNFSDEYCVKCNKKREIEKK